MTAKSLVRKLSPRTDQQQGIDTRRAKTLLVSKQKINAHLVKLLMLQSSEKLSICDQRKPFVVEPSSKIEWQAGSSEITHMGQKKYGLYETTFLL